VKIHLVESSFKSSLEMLELAARHSAILLLTSVRICRSAYEVSSDANKMMAGSAGTILDTPEQKRQS
jgi:hypothetical protein